MNLKDILGCLNGKIISKYSKLNTKINKIEIDSRKVTKGDIFVAIKGKNKDGNDYIPDAIKNGAKVVIVEKEVKIDKKKKIAIILVENTNQALLDLASYIRSKFDIPLIAITGSVGKTTTKELIACILSKKYNVLKNSDSNNNHIGLPLTLFKLKSEHDIIVTELGMNHRGEISVLSKIAKPSISIITNIGTSHIGNLKNKKNILKAKLEILDGMTKGSLIVNGNDKMLNRLKSSRDIRITKLTYENDDFKVFNIESDLTRTNFKLRYKNIIYDVNFRVPGKHLVNNIVLAIKVGLIFNVDIIDIISCIEEYKTVSKRMNIINLNNNNILIEDCYNSSYESLIGVLDLIKNIDRKKLLIIGDILELGHQSKKIHRKIGKYLDTISDKEVITVGQETKILEKKSKHFITNEEIKKYLDLYDIKDSVILVKGSRCMKLEEIKEYLVKKY